MIELDNLILEYGHFVTSICFRMIENRELAKEAAQESWLEIIKSIPSFKRNSKISTWIYTITSRTVLRYIKNEKRYSTSFISEFLQGEEMFYSNESSSLNMNDWTKEKCDQCITASIHCLSNRDRLIYLLYNGAGLNSKEISSLFDSTDIAIRKKISRSKDRLHNFLNKQCILYNPEGNCKCRMVKNVKKINLQNEFKKTKADIDKLSFIQQCDDILSNHRTFFKDLCHSYGFPHTN